MNDLTLEQTAVLWYVGAGDEVSDAWLDDILAAQRDDGGWSFAGDDSESDWHATALALWLLLQVQGPGDGEPFVHAASD